MSVAICFVLLAAQVAADKPAAPRLPVGRTAMVAIEKSFDTRIGRGTTLESLDLLGNARGVYLNGYGAVFSAEVSLAVGPWISPFRPTLRPDEIQMLHRKKLERLPVLKNIMRDWLVGAGASLDTLPPNEQIVIAVTLFYQKFEIREGLPGQVLMQAPRQVLLDIMTKKAAPDEIKVQEY